MQLILAWAMRGAFEVLDRSSVASQTARINFLRGSFFKDEDLGFCRRRLPRDRRLVRGSLRNLVGGAGLVSSVVFQCGVFAQLL